MGLNGASREGVNQGETIRLTIQYQDQAGNVADPPSIPNVTILDVNNAVVITAADPQVIRLDKGLYSFDYLVPSTAALGLWKDMWSVTINGVPFNKTLTFTVNEQANPITAIAGQELDPSLNAYATKNVLELIKLLKLRLASDGQRRKRDEFGKPVVDVNGNPVLEPCPVFATDELYAFLKASLAEFNSIPHFTYFNFDNQIFVDTFKHELVEGAMIMALVKQALLERGREFNMTDDGLSYQPPQIAELLKGIFSDLMTSYRERLKFIKCQFKPGPRGIGSVWSLAGAGISPAYARLRHLRQRQVI